MQRVGKLMKLQPPRIALNILVIFNIIMFLSCAGYAYEPYYPVPVTTSKNTYLRFRFENKRSEEEKQLLNDKDRYWKFFSYHFHVRIWTSGELFKNVKEFRTINPEVKYWRRYYKPGTIYYRVGINPLYFVEGCEYKMPIPIGKTKFEFSFYGDEPFRFADMIKIFDIQPNHSIRVIFDIDGSPQEEDERETQYRSNKNRVPIRISVEPNPEPDEDKICELPKHPRD
ncbi:putative lipoprotein [Leptospira interrogans serovar Grippotyphosa str. LT2186]|uniref:Putative lipoprotein n=4 Tax=Leptospira interrogans TaxID=173 RepID=A0A0E2DBG1_LEPIR|nr:putative lipoprotein [Leptospira interrogans str. UI 12758]EMG07944.1 putative lipoprotein [Leptospira interrogans serovar Grippotyphosa str. LT2186]EMN73254.1 putative lipoprotein [Leptospira interrogans serovar Bataviae str. UI 08561]EMO96022.1 putative lipoprotein [Leptospira interrogans str. UI 13372]